MLQILCTLALYVIGVGLSLWLSAPLLLVPASAALGWDTLKLQYITAIALLALLPACIPFSCIPIPTFCAWVVYCICHNSIYHTV